MNPRIVLALTLLAVFALGAAVLAARGGNEEPTEGRLKFEGAELPPNVKTPDFALRNQDGELVRMSELRGPVIVTFLYSDCDESCPPQAQQIKGALAELEDDAVPALAIALEPEKDTPENARHFLEEQGMTGKMDFVLGSREELEKVWDGFYIQPQTEEIEHQARITIVADGLQRVGYPLEQATPERIAHDVRVLQRES